MSRPDKRFFYPPGAPNFTGIKGLRFGDGVALFQDQLIVADAGRLMFWNGLATLTNGKTSDGVVGDEAYRRDWPSCCENIKTDGTGRLWVNSQEGSSGFIDVYELPLTHQSAPLNTIWTKDRTIPIAGTTDRLSIGEGRLWGLVPAEGGKFLWVSDTDNHRVVRIRDPLTSPMVDVILGQKGTDGTMCNRGEKPPRGHYLDEVDPNMLCYPGSLSLDRVGNLWISDHSLEANGNYRLLMFSRDLFPTNVSSTIFATGATKIFARHAMDDPRTKAVFRVEASSRLIEGGERGPYRTATFEPAFDSRNRMVVGYNSYMAGRFVGVYHNPLGEGVEPSGYSMTSLRGPLLSPSTTTTTSISETTAGPEFWSTGIRSTTKPCLTRKRPSWRTRLLCQSTPRTFSHSVPDRPHAFCEVLSISTKRHWRLQSLIFPIRRASKCIFVKLQPRTYVRGPLTATTCGSNRECELPSPVSGPTCGKNTRQLGPPSGCFWTAHL